ncbi:glycolipid 2-alpha-mannosyltransferase-domain-containing protein [Xylariomycetidae sp. FL0641]|nr:glycolipid 2-alpha-mannosyltransferase-domain-containing protein [Xylariomycetidae sp. FL0641]
MASNSMDSADRDGEQGYRASSPNSILDRPHHHHQRFSWTLLFRRFQRSPLRKLFVLVCLLFFVFGGALRFHKNQLKRLAPQHPVNLDVYLPPIAQLPSPLDGMPRPDPLQWLRDNIIMDVEKLDPQHREVLLETKPRAAFIALVRNSEVEDMVNSIVELEARFNNRTTHHYDWVFFNDEDFSEAFMKSVADATSARCLFEVIPTKHWSVPSWVDVTRFDVGRHFMGSIGVGKAWLQSYHHMCRWNAGLFALEERLTEYEYFWRVEPGVSFTCNINYDVFRFMRDNNLKYGFNMAILDDARSFPSLWDRTRTFIKGHRDLLHEYADLDWVLQETERRDEAGGSRLNFDDDKDPLDYLEYNNCQFYSNFEIGSLDFFRGKEHQAYFEHLDKTGGFYYERFGDAPIHTLSVSMFLPKSQIWYFRDIGYAHGLCEQCPPHEHTLARPSTDPSLPDDSPDAGELVGGELAAQHRWWDLVARDFQRQSTIPGLYCGCTVSAIDQNNAKLVPFESKQRKPQDACMRLYLGGMWLKKTPAWTVEKELAAGRLDDVLVNDDYLFDGTQGNPFVATDPPTATSEASEE